MAIVIGTDGSNKPDLLSDPVANYGLEDDWVVGFDGDDKIFTGAGNDFLDGGPDTDQLSGGDGNDTIVAGEGDDSVYADAGNDFYSGGGGTDTLYFYYLHWGARDEAEENTFGVTVDLAVTAPQDLGVYGIDRIIGFEDLGGGTGNDTFFGTSDANRLDGSYGDDALYGRAGNDSLEGGAGADTLVGGTGTDVIETFGLGNADTFRDVVRYLALNESGTPKDRTTWDAIHGFKHGQDKIDLSAIDADISRAGNQAFTLVNAFSGAYGEVHLKKDGADMLVEIDGGKNTGIDMVIRLYHVATLNKSDFIL